MEEIAAVKAGIIKEKCPVFSAPQQSGVEQILFEHANRKQAELRMVEEGDCQLLEEALGRLAFSYKGKNYVTVGDTDAYLTHLYGDYMTPVDTSKRVAGHVETF